MKSKIWFSDVVDVHSNVVDVHPNVVDVHPNVRENGLFLQVKTTHDSSQQLFTKSKTLALKASKMQENLNNLNLDARKHPNLDAHEHAVHFNNRISKMRKKGQTFIYDELMIDDIKDSLSMLDQTNRQWAQQQLARYNQVTQTRRGRLRLKIGMNI